MRKTIFIAVLFIISSQLIAQNQTSPYKKIDKALELIENQYVDSMNMDELVIEAINGMIKKLDPHTKYLSANELSKNNEALNGSFGGIGVHYQILYDTMLILSVTPGGPSELGGIKSGDKLIMVDTTLVVGKQTSNSYFTSLLRGQVGSTLQLKIKRKGKADLIHITVTRGPIPIKTIDASFMLDKETGYIKINGFSFTTMNEFNLAANFMRMNGMKNLIIDLRGNPGGLMIASINLADEFLKSGEIIVYTEGVHYKRENYRSTERGEFNEGRLIVIVDELSASASEIFAGAIQDLDRGIIVGRRTYGKGLVGRNFNLPDGSALRLTTGHYYTPSGRCIQKPYEDGIENYKNDLSIRYKNGEYLHADSIKFSDSLKYLTKKGRIIYGGGGIMPDIFFPIDTNKLPEYEQTLNKYGVINAFAGAYFDKNLQSLQEKYPELEDFKQKFIPNEDEFKQLQAFAKEYYRIEPENNLKVKEIEKILLEFKTYLGRNLYENGAIFKLSWQSDDMIVNSLRIINDKKEFKREGIEF